jgi:hypothetical protein
MKLDPGMHIGMHLVSFGKSGVTVLTRLCLVQTRPPDRPTVPSNGPSVHSTLLSLRLLFSNSSDVTRKGTVGSSDGVKLTPVDAQCTKCSDAMHRWYRRFIRRCLFPSFFRVFNLDFCFNLTSLTYLTCHYL